MTWSEGVLGMDTAEFWAIVNECKAVSGGSFEERKVLLREKLQELTASEIVGFQKEFERHMELADTVPLMEAAALVGGGCSDDGFVDFRRWLISVGSEIYGAAVANPDTLADVEFGGRSGERDCFFESFGYVAGEVYWELTGEEMPFEVPSVETSLERLQRHQADRSRANLPRLRKKYGNQESERT